MTNQSTILIGFAKTMAWNPNRNEWTWHSMTNDAKKSYGRLPSKIQLGKYQGVGFGGYLRLSGTDAVTFGAKPSPPERGHTDFKIQRYADRQHEGSSGL